MWFDRPVFELINTQWAWSSLDKLMAIMSSFAFWIPILALLGIAVAMFGGRKGRFLIICLALVIGLTEAVAVNSIKNLFHRPRPSEVLVGTRIVALEKARPQTLALFKPAAIGHSVARNLHATGKSFPSGHTTDNFAALAVFVAFYRWRGALYLIPAALVAYSRIYVGKHWPSDVLASIFLGLGCAWLILALFRWLRRRPRLAPVMERQSDQTPGNN